MDCGNRNTQRAPVYSRERQAADGTPYSIPCAGMLRLNRSAQVRYALKAGAGWHGIVRFGCCMVPRPATAHTASSHRRTLLGIAHDFWLPYSRRRCFANQARQRSVCSVFSPVSRRLKAGSARSALQRPGVRATHATPVHVGTSQQ